MYAIEHYRENLKLLVEDISLYAQIPSRTRTRMGREGETSMMASNSNYKSAWQRLVAQSKRSQTLECGHFK